MKLVIYGRKTLMGAGAGLAALVLPLTALSGTAHAADAHTSSAARPAVVRPMSGNGYVSDGRLRHDPNLGSPVIDEIYNQWVTFTCYLDSSDNGYGSNRWFKATYYGQTGYMSSGVVSSQPSLPHC